MTIYGIRSMRIKQRVARNEFLPPALLLLPSSPRHNAARAAYAVFPHTMVCGALPGKREASHAPACTYQAVFCYILVSLYFVGDTPVDALKHLLKYFGSANPQA